MSKKNIAQSIEEKLNDLLKPIFQGSKKEFLLINNLVKNWSEIVGQKYSQFCYPKSINFNKDRTSGGKLTISVYNAAVGFFLENNSDLIIERIASFYGFKSVTKIIIKQEPKNVKHSQDQEIKLTKNEENFIQAKLSQISDTDLAKTIENLGKEILKNDRSKHKF